MIKVQYTSFLYFLVCLTFLERIIRDVFVLNNMKFKSVAIFTLLLMRRRFSTLPVGALFVPNSLALYSNYSHIWYVTTVIICHLSVSLRVGLYKQVHVVKNTAALSSKNQSDQATKHSI